MGKLLTVASALAYLASAGKQYIPIDDGIMDDSGPYHGYALDYEETTTTDSVTTTEPTKLEGDRGEKQFVLNIGQLGGHTQPVGDDERGKNKNKNKDKNKKKKKKTKDKPSWEDCAELDPADYGAKDLS